jgi:dihydrolipoamide dehydrogenase
MLSRVVSKVRASSLSLSRRRFSSANPAEQSDVVIIGGGPGGYVAAIKGAQLGLKVTCVEKRGRLGGTCNNVGCVPSKALLNISHMYEQTKHFMPKHGISFDEAKFDLPTIMKSKTNAVLGLSNGVELLFRQNRVNYEKGVGKIIGNNQVEVERLDGTKTLINTKNIVIATGSEPASLSFPIDEKRIVTSTGALELSEVPKSMVVIGGGIIGLELGSVWSRLGAKVTVVEVTDAICGGADKEIATTFKRTLEKQGFQFKMKSKVLSAVNNGNSCTVVVEDVESRAKETLEVDVVLVAIGRKPYTAGLGLEQLGVKIDQRGIVETDDHFRTNVQGIFAIGDAIKGPMLAHKAEEEGIALMENLVTPGVGHVNYNAIPSVIYTHPEVAWVGQTEEKLKEKGIKYKVGKFPFKANSRARTNDDTDGMVKFITEAETDRILGVHIVGPNAGELIHESVLAIEYGASSEDVARTCHAHPTLSEAVKEAAMAAHGKPIHF